MYSRLKSTSVEGHLNPGLFNPRFFNHELFNPMVQKFIVEKSGVEMSFNIFDGTRTRAQVGVHVTNLNYRKPSKKKLLQKFQECKKTFKWNYSDCR